MRSTARGDISGKKMFGGIALMLNGNMCCGIADDLLMGHSVGPAAYDDALGRPHARPMDFTGRPMKGYVYVEPDGLRSDGERRNGVSRRAVRQNPSREIGPPAEPPARPETSENITASAPPPESPSPPPSFCTSRTRHTRRRPFPRAFSAPPLRHQTPCILCTHRRQKPRPPDSP